LNKEFNMDGELVKLKIYQAKQKLDDSPFNPLFHRAGILVKSDMAILDHTILGWDREIAAFYFYGLADIPGIAKRLREGEMLINPNRTGLDWKANYLDSLKEKISSEFSTLVNEKRRELDLERPTAPAGKYKDLINKINDLLNDFARKEELEWEIPIDPTSIDELMIKPESSSIEINKPRTFSVYAPKEIIELNPTRHLIIKCDSSNIEISKPASHFSRHKKYKNILISHFEITGTRQGEGLILGKLGDIEVGAYVYVVDEIEQSTHKRKGLIQKKGGFLRNITTDQENDPSQRVYYEEHLGEIRIFTNFPGVKEYIKPELVGAETPEGCVMLAELVSEAFCRVVAHKHLNQGKYPTLGSDSDSHITAYNNALFDLQRKYSAKIHNLIRLWRKNEQ